MNLRDLKDEYIGSLDPDTFEADDYEQYTDGIESSTDLEMLLETVYVWAATLELDNPAEIILRHIIDAGEKKDYEFLNAPYIPKSK